MIDWLHKLPDSAIGFVAAGAVWFGFNYAVLGERAMDRYAADTVMPACLASFEQPATPSVPKLGIGKLFGMPELDQLEDTIVQQATPRVISRAKQVAACECSVASAKATLRMDYALNTASFRIFSPESIASFRRQTTLFLTDGACGNQTPGAGQ